MADFGPRPDDSPTPLAQWGLPAALRTPVDPFAELLSALTVDEPPPDRTDVVERYVSVTEALPPGLLSSPFLSQGERDTASAFVIVTAERRTLHPLTKEHFEREVHRVIEKHALLSTVYG